MRDGLAQSAIVVLAAVAVIVALGQWGVGANARAQFHEERADSLGRAHDRQTQISDGLRELVRASDSAYAADRIRWETERAQNRAEIAAAERNASDAAAALRPRLDSIGGALLAQYEAEVERERVNQRALVKTLDAEIVSLRTQVKRRDELIASLYAEIDISRQETDALRAANDALADALRARSRQATLLKVAGVGLLGLAVYNGVQG